MLNKIRFTFILLVGFIFPLTGCGESRSYEPEFPSFINTNENYITISLNSENLIYIGEEEILFMTTDGFVLASNRNWGGNNELWINRFGNVLGGVGSVEMYSFENGSISWRTLAFGYEDYFYIPVTITSDNYNNHKVVRLNSNMPPLTPGRDTRRTSEVLLELPEALYINLFSQGDYLIMFVPRFSNEIFVYDVIKVNLSNNHNEVIIEKVFSPHSNTGDIIANIFVYNESIFMYRMNISETGNTSHFVDEYDFGGNLINSFDLDIDEFLFMEQVNDHDTITMIYRVDNFFILQTLHNRISIFGISGNYWTEIGIPDSLQKVRACLISFLR